jgi:hypothetical protein
MLQIKVKPQSIAWFSDLYNSGKLDLDPPYQRGGEVWSPEFKNYFIDTILKGFPSPAIFLNVETKPDGRTTYHVVDGKQRLTTIFEFIRGDFPVGKPKKDFSPLPTLVGKTFKEIDDVDVRTAFWEYEMPVEEVLNARPEELIQAFDRLNRNVARLAKQELRHARYSGTFINLMETFADEAFWEDFGLFSKAKTRRMGDVEFVSEIFLLTMHGPQDGSDAVLDNYYADYEDEIPDVERHRKNYEACKAMFVECGAGAIKDTRFKNLGDFYSLWGAFREFMASGRKFYAKRTTNRLTSFSELLEKLPKVDDKRSPSSRALNAEIASLVAQLPITEEEASSYSDAVRQGTNKLANRQTRINVLESLIRKSR